MRYVFSAVFFFLASSMTASAVDAPSFPEWKAAGVSVADAQQVESAYLFFAALPQQPFQLELARGGTGLPQEDLQAERLLLLRKAAAVALRYPKVAQEILAPFETVLLAERGGKALSRTSVRGQVDAHTDLAQELYGTREALKERATGVPSLSATQSFTFQEFERGEATIFFGKGDGSLKVFESAGNALETDPKKKTYWVAPDAELVEVTEQKDGSYLVQIRFADFVRQARGLARQHATAKAALSGQWNSIGVEKIVLREGADGAALVSGISEKSPKHGDVYSFRLSAAQMRKAAPNNELFFTLQPAARFDGKANEVRLEGSAVLPKKNSLVR